MRMFTSSVSISRVGRKELLGSKRVSIEESYEEILGFPW